MSLVRKYGPRRRINAALRNVTTVITVAGSGGRLASALAAEGYDGGYRDALMDVQLLLNGNIPDRYGWWEVEEEK